MHFPPRFVRWRNGDAKHKAARKGAGSQHGEGGRAVQGEREAAGAGAYALHVQRHSMRAL